MITKEETRIKCTEYKMNKYGCLFLTKGFKCYYKDDECKDYIDD